MDKAKEAAKAAVAAAGFALVAISAYVAAEGAELREDIAAFITAGAAALGAGFTALKAAWRNR
jgi:hypothetical protein